LVFLLFAIPVGRLADRVGRWRIFLFGNGFLLVTYLLIGSSLPGAALLVASIACYGTYYAATDGVLMAVATPHLPAVSRTGGMALIQTCGVGGSLLAGLAFGTGWMLWGPYVSLLAFAGVLFGALVVACVARPGSRAGAIDVSRRRGRVMRRAGRRQGSEGSR